MARVVGLAIKFSLGLLWLVVGFVMLRAGLGIAPIDVITTLIGVASVVVAGLFFWWGVRVLQKEPPDGPRYRA